MPIQPTYPGVYVEEISSGVHTITGVPTSVTAFLGRTKFGPADQPVVITGFSDFEQLFGGLSVDFPVSYAVRDFYLNGGSRAVIVRLFKSAAGGANGIATADLGSGLTLNALGPGTWYNKIQATVDTNSITSAIAQQYGVAVADLFNLTVQFDPQNNGPKEVYRNLTVINGPRRIDYALSPSQFVQVATPFPSNPKVPASKAYSLAGGAESGALTGSVDFLGNPNQKTGMYALDRTDIFNLLCIPPDTRDGDIAALDGDSGAAYFAAAMQYCNDRRALLIVDPSPTWAANVFQFTSNAATDITPMINNVASNAALFFPRVIEADPLHEGQIDTFVPCGLVAGIMARTDANRGVWKAPAGTEATLNGVMGLQVNLTNDENGLLNPLGINCFRSFPIIGQVIWGSRTLRGADQLADDYKYIPVRRTALFIEESLYRGLQWVVFEPNDEPLWAQIRLNVGAFMHDLFRKGAFQGSTPQQAYLVKCDSETTTQTDINNGIVNIIVGFAPLKPAEFVIIKIEQLAGQIQV